MKTPIVNVKMDAALHKELKKTCNDEGISMNRFIINAIHRELEFTKLWVDPKIPEDTGDWERDKAAREKAISEAREMNIALLLHK
jgi:hypothetical protein